MSESNAPPYDESGILTNGKAAVYPSQTRPNDHPGPIRFVEVPRPPGERLDVLVLNPPTLESDPRAMRRGRSRIALTQPQTALAQIGAVAQEDGYHVDVLDAAGQRMPWDALERLIRQQRPRYLILSPSAPTIMNDMRATLLGKATGAITVATGPYVTALARETLEVYPSLDIVVRGEPELTILDLIHTIDHTPAVEILRELAVGELLAPTRRQPVSDASYLAGSTRSRGVAPGLLARALRETRGVAFRDEYMEVQINPDRPFIDNLDTLPLPLHDRLPWPRYSLPMIGGPYTFVLTSRGCPAACRYCIKHVTYQSSVRHRSTDHILEELCMLQNMGLRHVHFEADLFTVRKEFVYDLCGAIIKQGLQMRWSCNSRADVVDEQELGLMQRAGCSLIAWGLESGSDEVLKRARRGTMVQQIEDTIAASRRAGIKNWGCFMIGLPGETVATIQQTIALSKRLRLDIAQFQIATPYPGTPFYYEAIQNGWIQLDDYEELAAPGHGVLSYPHLSAAEIEGWTRRAAREWGMRPGPLWTFLKSAVRRESFAQIWRGDINQPYWMGGSFPQHA